MSRWGITRSGVVVAVVMGMLTGVSAAAQEEDVGPGNRALIDTDATSAAIDATTSLSEDRCDALKVPFGTFNVPKGTFRAVAVSRCRGGGRPPSRP